MKHRLFLVAALVGVLLSGAQAQKPSVSTHELVRGAVSEAWELAMELEPDGGVPYAKLATLMALLDGPQSLPAVDAITHRVVRSGTYGQSLRLLKISTLADLVQSLLGPPERTEFLYSNSYNLRRQPAGTQGRLAELDRWEATTFDLKPHIRTLLFAVERGDRELAGGAAERANARFAAADPNPSLALEMVVVLQLRDWIGADRYAAGVRQLIDRLGPVVWPGVEFSLTTKQGSIELEPAEYYAFELLRREKITGQIVGLERLSGLDEKLEQVGGWDEVHRWYRRDRIDQTRGLVPGNKGVDETLIADLETARAEPKPGKRLQQLLDSVRDWVLEWRRPSGAPRSSP